MGARNGGLKSLEVICLVKHLVALWVEISNLADVFFALRLGHGTVCLRNLRIVLNDLHGLEIALEL